MNTLTEPPGRPLPFFFFTHVFLSCPKPGNSPVERFSHTCNVVSWPFTGLALSCAYVLTDPGRAF